MSDMKELDKNIKKNIKSSCKSSEISASIQIMVKDPQDPRNYPVLTEKNESPKN